jgi:hypothetical protein
MSAMEMVATAAPIKLDLDEIERRGLGDMDALAEAAAPVLLEQEGGTNGSSAGTPHPKGAGRAETASTAAGAAAWFVMPGTGHRWLVTDSPVEDKRKGSLVAVLVLEVEEEPGRFVAKHRGRVDLNGDRSRALFVKAAADATGRPELLETITQSLTSLSIDLPREIAERATRAAAVPTARPDPLATTPPALIKEARALSSLPADALAAALLEDARALGLVHEERNFLALVLATVSRLLSRPVNVMVRGPASIGKSYVSDLVVSLVPAEELVALSDMSEKALYHVREDELAHRVFLRTERPKLLKGEEDRGSHVLRDLMQKGEASYKVAVAQEKGSPPIVVDKRTRGPIAFIETTTNTQILDEDLSRMVELYPDESAEQTRRIVAAAARDAASSGRHEREAMREAIRERWRTLHRLLTRAWITPERTRHPIEISIPYAERLAPRMEPPPSSVRRLFGHILGFVRASVVLRSLPRLDAARAAAAAATAPGGNTDAAPASEPHMELRATLDDYALAFRVLPAIVGRAAGAISDEARLFLMNLRDAVSRGTVPATFGVRDLEKALRENRDAIRRRLRALEALDFVDDVTPPPGEGKKLPRNAPRSYRLGLAPDATAQAFLPSPDELRAEGVE